MVQSVRCLVCKHKDLSLTHRHHLKSWAWWRSFVIPALRRWRQAMPGTWWVSMASERHCQKWERDPKKGHSGSTSELLTPLCIHSSISARINFGCKKTNLEIGRFIAMVIKVKHNTFGQNGQNPTLQAFTKFRQIAMGLPRSMELRNGGFVQGFENLPNP